jgi:hypothetical protein
VVKGDTSDTKKGITTTTTDPIDSDDETQYSPINNYTTTMKFTGSKYMNCESVPVIIMKEIGDLSNNLNNDTDICNSGTLNTDIRVSDNGIDTIQINGTLNVDINNLNGNDMNICNTDEKPSSKEHSSSSIRNPDIPDPNIPSLDMDSIKVKDECAIIDDIEKVIN